VSSTPLVLAEACISLSGNSLPAWLTEKPGLVSFLGLGSLAQLGWVADDCILAEI
jgi:hypothetical protein